MACNAAIVGARPTGLGVYATQSIAALARLGEQLVVYTSRPDAITGLGVAIRRAPMVTRPELGTRGHLARLLWGQVWLRRSLKVERPRVLLSLMPDGIFSPPVSQIVTVHDLVPLRYPDQHPRLRYYFRYWVPRMLRHCSGVVTISEASRQDIVSFYGVAADRVHVAPCGYDPGRFSPNGAAEDGGEPYALYVGNVMPHKNLLRMVDGFAMATRRIPGRLVIRGRGRSQHVQALRKRISERELSCRVDWQPYAEGDELSRLYRGARMLLLPSLFEGFGLTALEAMACGTPVVTSNTSSLPEVVGDAGLLVDPLDTMGLADAIGRLFVEDRLAKELGERGIARAREFTWERTGREVQRAIRAALGQV